MENSQITYADLPIDCLLRIIAFLTLPDVAALLQTSRLWHSVITDNQQTVYRQFATSCEFMGRPTGSLEDALKGWASQEAAKIQGWKQYCQLQLTTRRRWYGKGRAYSSNDIFGSAQQTDVHRIKIDTEKSLLVLSGEGEEGDLGSDDDSCLVVHCLRDPKQPALFRLGQVSGYAHVEMSNGFIMFTCGGSDVLELWRWAQDQATDPLDRNPTQKQLSVYERAMESAGFQSGSPHRGELVPMALLRHPAELRASRLVYPTLCVGSRAGDQIWLWDIRTRSLTQTINIEPSRYPRFSMLYVDVNETHVFVATHTVSVYSRATGQCVFQLLEQHFALLVCVQIPSFAMRRSGIIHTFEELTLQRYVKPYMYPHLVGFALRQQHAVLAVHVSPSGDDFVVITSHGYILHVSGLKSGGSGIEATQNANDGASGPDNSPSPQAPHDPNAKKPSLENFRISAAQTGTVGRGLDNLAYDGNRILAFGEKGLCLLHVEHQPGDVFEASTGQGPTLKLHPFPSRFIYYISPFGRFGGAYRNCSCLQMTEDSFWVAWEPESRHDGDSSALTRRRWNDGLCARARSSSRVLNSGLGTISVSKMFIQCI